MEKMEVNGNCLIAKILQNIFFCVCSAAEGNSYRFRNKIWL